MRADKSAVRRREAAVIPYFLVVGPAIWIGWEVLTPLVARGALGRATLAQASRTIFPGRTHLSARRAAADLRMAQAARPGSESLSQLADLEVSPPCSPLCLFLCSSGPFFRESASILSEWALKAPIWIKKQRPILKRMTQGLTASYLHLNSVISLGSF